MEDRDSDENADVAWVIQDRRVGLAAPIRDEFTGRWRRFNDPEFLMLLGMPRMPPFTREAREKAYDELTASPSVALFDVRLIDDSRVLGETFLHQIRWPEGNAEVALSIYEDEDRAQGYGTEAMALLIAFAFDVLGLNRVSIRFLTGVPGVATAVERHGPAFGAELVGVEHQAAWAFGHRHDVAVWELLRDRFPAHRATAKLREGQKGENDR